MANNVNVRTNQKDEELELAKGQVFANEGAAYIIVPDPEFTSDKLLAANLSSGRFLYPPLDAEELLSELVAENLRPVKDAAITVEGDQ